VPPLSAGVPVVQRHPGQSHAKTNENNTTNISALVEEKKLYRNFILFYSYKFHLFFIFSTKDFWYWGSSSSCVTIKLCSIASSSLSTVGVLDGQETV
jgi:hypothetical protein